MGIHSHTEQDKLDKNNVETAQDDGVYSAEEVFKMLRESLEISEDINDYDMRNMMVIRKGTTESAITPTTR